MSVINESKLILEKEVFKREEIEKRMRDGGFNSIAKFELFIWDLEIFLQLQRILGDGIILKGGAATQFYIPITGQRTSIDIDVITIATREQVHEALSIIEQELEGEKEYCKFRQYVPKNPRLELSTLETYFFTIPSVCNSSELFATHGRQEVKIEFLYSNGSYKINKIQQPELFALETSKVFNVLVLENLFADKLTTLGPNTIGVPDDRADEQFKHIYDVITLFNSNLEQIIKNKKQIADYYDKVALEECKLHKIEYQKSELIDDIKHIIKRIQNIEHENDYFQKARDFQSLYLRSSVNRDKTQWSIVGYQIEYLVNFLLGESTVIKQARNIEYLVDRLKFSNIVGPARGEKIKEVRAELARNFSGIGNLTPELFQKRFDRIIWELVGFVSCSAIEETIKDIINT